MKNGLIIDGSFLNFNDGENEIGGYIKGNSYYLVTAKFNGAFYEKKGIRWIRSKRGSLSKAFVNWLEETQQKVYKEFYNL